MTQEEKEQKLALQQRELKLLKRQYELTPEDMEKVIIEHPDSREQIAQELVEQRKVNASQTEQNSFSGSEMAQTRNDKAVQAQEAAENGLWSK